MSIRLQNILSIAKRCSQYGMCRIDYLSHGVCPSARSHFYASYYPHGRMAIAVAVCENLLPVTQRFVDIVETCSLCGICDKQCYFITELRPLKVMQALKEYLIEYLGNGGIVENPEEDEFLTELRGIVGNEWATNDRAIGIAYSTARSPFAERKVPAYVVLPESTKQVAEIVKLAKSYGVPFVPRGAGTSFSGALTEGLVIDMVRMDTIEIHREKFTASIGAGVTNFQLQKEATQHDFIANVAEPAACTCANIVTTNLHSFFSHSYGMGADHFIDAEIVTNDGKICKLSEGGLPNVFTFRPSQLTSERPYHGICTNMEVKLYPRTHDEQGVLIPFSDFGKALKMLREVGRRQIGIAAGLIGSEYMSVFPSPTFKVSQRFKYVLKKKLGIEYMLMVVGDSNHVRALKKMTDVVWEQDIVNTLFLGIPRLYHNQGLELLTEFPDTEPIYKILFEKDMRSLTEMALLPSADNIAETVDDDMKGFFRELYSCPEMINLVHQNMFRILSARLGRRHDFAPRIIWCPLDEIDVILEICQALRAIGQKHSLHNDFGYIVPVHMGKRAVMEYDYYFDQTDDTEKQNVKNALLESEEVIRSFAHKIKGLIVGHDIVFQGLSRPESYLYV